MNIFEQLNKLDDNKSLLEATEKSNDPEKQKLWERFFEQYDQVSGKLTKVVSDLKQNKEEQREYTKGKEYIDKLTNYYKTIERLIIREGNSIQEIEESIKTAEKYIRAAQSFINRHTEGANTDGETNNKEELLKSSIDENTVKRFIQLSKRLNKQLFFKDKNGSMKRVAPSKYDTITSEHLSHIYVNKTGKEEGCLATIIPQLKQENLIESIQDVFKEKTYMTNSVNLQEAELVDRPREVGASYKYPTIPLTYRDELKKQGFVQGRTVTTWLKDYKGYTIMVHEGTNRKRLEVQVKRGGTPFRGEKIGGDLLSGTKIAYTEEQLFKIIKEFEEKIDKMRKDPSDRVTVNVDDSFDWNFMTEGMNRLEDQMNADVTKIIDYTKANIDAFLRHDEGIEWWLNDMSECGKLDIPAEYCDDYENVTDKEAFNYFRDLVTKTDLVDQLNELRSLFENNIVKSNEELRESIKVDPLVDNIVTTIEKSGFTNRSITSTNSTITMENKDGSKTTYIVKVKQVPQYVLEEEMIGDIVRTFDKDEFIKKSAVKIVENN